MRRLRSLKGIRGWVKNAWDSMQGWLIMFMIGMLFFLFHFKFSLGIASGSVAAAMDISTKWLSDLKSGFCRSDYLLNRTFCCWDYLDKEACSNWIPWNQAIAEALFGTNVTFTWGYYINWMAYVVIGVYLLFLNSF